MADDFETRDGALRVRLAEPAWRAAWEAVGPWAVPGALHPLPDVTAGDRPGDQVLAAAQVACAAPVGVQVVTSRQRSGLLATLGLGRVSAAAVVRPVAGGTDLTVGRGVEVSAFDLRATTLELRRLLPHDTHADASSPAPDDRVVTMPAELAAVATRALRAGDEAAARQACRLAGLDDVPPLLEALTHLVGTAGLTFRSPAGLRVQRLLATHLGWVEVTPTAAGVAHRLLTHDELVSSWVTALSLSVNDVAGAAS